MAHPRRFSDTAAADLRRRYEAGATMRELAAEHGCGVATVKRALCRVGTTWRPPHRFTREHGDRGRQTNGAIRKAAALRRGREIVRLRLAGEKWIVIAMAMGVSSLWHGSVRKSAEVALIADNADAETWARVFPQSRRHRPAQHKEAA